MAFMSLAAATMSLKLNGVEVLGTGINANSGLIGESDAIEFPQEVEHFMRKVGVRGEKEWGRTGERGGDVKIRTMATSVLGHRIRQKFNAQRKIGLGEFAAVPVSLDFKDETNGEKWSGTGGVIKAGPHGPKAGSSGYEPSIWTIEFEDIDYDPGSEFEAAVA